MKKSGTWIIACLVGALAIAVFLPKFGLPVAGASLVTILIIGCCVIPMVVMMYGLLSGKK